MPDAGPWNRVFKPNQPFVFLPTQGSANPTGSFIYGAAATGGPVVQFN